MTKLELIKKAIEHNPFLKRAKVEKGINAILAEITEHVSKGGRVELRGFGVFEVRGRKERVGRNPRTGEKVIVPGKSVPFFKAGKSLKEEINK